MKKSVLLTSILFSSMMLGSGIFDQAQITTKASDSTEVQNENSVKNTIRFVNQDKMPLNPYHNTDYTFTGKVGDDINLESAVPVGYRLHNEELHLKIQNNDEIRVVMVDAQEVINYVNFKDTQSKRILKSVTLTGKVGDVFEIPKLPEGFHYEDYSEDTITLSATEKEIDIWMVENPKEKNVKLKFIDKNGRYISEKNIKCPIGKVYYLPTGIAFNHYLSGYELEDNQPISFAVNENTNEVEIKVRKAFVKNTIQFKDNNGNIVSSVDVEGKKDFDEDISFILPRGFSLKYKENQTFKFGNDGSTILVNVVKNVTNKVQYITSSGDEIETVYVEGTVGEDIRLEIPKGYTLINSKVINFNSTEGYIHKVVLKGQKLNTKLILKDVRYPHQDKFILEKLYSGMAGDKVPNDIIPHEYVLSNRNIIRYEVPDQIVWVTKKVNLVINYIDSFGRIVGNQKSTNLDKEIVNFSVPKGYLVVNNPVGKIEVNQEHPVQNVLVVPTNGIQQPELPNAVSTQINFIDRKNNKVIHSYVVQGQHGQSHSIQVPEGYDLAKGVTNKLTLDKSKKLINIYMVEKESINTNGVVVSHSKTVLTKQTANLYDKNGKRITNRALGHSSGWKSDQKMVLNGVTYYRVATNEYVRASDIVEYEPAVSVISTTNGSAKYLYDIHGKRSSNRALSSNTAWFTDKLAIINGEKMYRVATNEWVKASDIK